MSIHWIRDHRRKQILEAPFPSEWRGILAEHFPLWDTLSDDERARLGDIIQILVDEKSWEGCGGLEMRDEVKVTIAAQAGLLLLNIPHDYYQNVDSVLVYPAEYLLPSRAEGALAGVLAPTAQPVLGHAQWGGPVVLNWRKIEADGDHPNDGRNLVYHEFAHKLDMLGGAVNGTPELATQAQLDAWIATMTREYEALRDHESDGLIREYGATNVAEFFAVVTELFFERSRRMKRTHPKLYQVLSDFYVQDPASRASAN